MSFGNDGQQYSGLDSITLGQLRSIVGTGPKPKQTFYDFQYEDEDNLFEEINEFYAFTEVDQLAENLRLWTQGAFTKEWTTATPAERKVHIVTLLENLEHQDSFIRYATTRQLLYLLQGVFAETTSQEHQMRWIIENCRTVREADGVTVIVDALKVLSAKHEKITALTDADLNKLNVPPSQRQQWVDEVQAEISMCLGMLYPIIEVFRSDDKFAEELMGMEPPLPIYLFQLIASLHRGVKSYPAKKLLLVTWKTILACLGGTRELERAKGVARELAGLPPLKQKVIVKSTPIDLQTFRQETSVKYPTFTPPPVAEVPTLKLSEAFAPIPIRHHYNHHDDDEASNSILAANGYNHNRGQQHPHQATPAPTPPPSPKPKKQQYQTDQTKPFIFPFAPAARVSKKLVPFAIDEADNLYTKHLHVSLALFQMWRTREDFVLYESGLNQMPRDDEVDQALKRFSIISTRNPNADDDDDDDDPSKELPDMKRLEEAIKDTERILKKAESSDDKSEKKQVQDRLQDLLRLRRVETIYSESLPFLATWSLVLLKFLLAVITVNNANGNIDELGSMAPVIPPSLEELDALRHREIMTKALSALILLLLKWYKRSHIMKFHYLGHTLLESNCLLLSLRLLGLQEISTYVVTKNEIPERRFFRYCYENFAPGVPRPQWRDPYSYTTAPMQPPKIITKTNTLPNGVQVEEEIEMITDFSWRNFFTVVNLTKIMQKLTKGRTHRIMIMVHHKSTAIFKRMMKISHPMLQLQLLKLIKSQVPLSGRKWKQLNMKLITAIYLNCRPELRDEWLTSTEVEDLTDAVAQEAALASLFKFYNTRRYGSTSSHLPLPSHRRHSSSLSLPNPSDISPDLNPPTGSISSRSGFQSPPAHQDVFPPLRSQTADHSIFMPYPTEDLAFDEEYEQYLSDLGYDHSSAGGGATGTDDWSSLHGGRLGTGLVGIGAGNAAWNRLPSEQPIGDGISDSESVASLVDLTDRTGADGKTEVQDDSEVGKNNWEHMSPKTLQAIAKSPNNRRSSSGSGLRPVMPFDLDSGSAIADEEEEPAELGPMPRERDTPFAAQEGGKGVDEVEFFFGE